MEKKRTGKFNKFKQYLKDIFFPRNIKCVFCKEELNNKAKNNTCELCLNSLPFINKACARCGGILNEEATGVCVDCKLNNYEFVKAVSVFEYKDSIVGVIQNLKYKGKKYLVEPIAKYMAEKLNKENLEIDYVTSVPIYESKMKLRGFNQSELIAREICELLNYSYLDLMVKVVNTRSQTELNFSERRNNVKDSFKINPEYKKEIKDKVILVVDDIFTTGATSNEVCKTLLNAGAKKCYVLTFAHVNINRIS